MAAAKKVLAVVQRFKELHQQSNDTDHNPDLGMCTDVICAICIASNHVAGSSRSGSSSNNAPFFITTQKVQMWSIAIEDLLADMDRAL